MTRGQIAIIYKGYNAKTISVMTSIEFNGDMYPDGDGEDAIKLLTQVNDVANYQYIVGKFNNDHHHYCDCDRLTFNTEKEEAQRMLDFSEGYFDKWFSDYVYLKNITKENVDIVTETRNDKGDVTGKITTTIAPNSIAVLCFGKLKEIVK